ncbi:HAMP domain-containing protein [Nocardioides sp. GY 10113]|uniref:sensor histidine kinase n=1 Tax=Nocardioides sp. GY 10113 TaxID=2569761 RepID=UPI0010A78721|nr:sensor histidine kinase [Nocardioides sp. GY 10113]TIC79240.1 HAMP domain-containing protein [Nocardioides sp. GY 10113]
MTAPEAAQPARATGISRITVQGWFYLVLAVMLVIVGVGVVVGAEQLDRTVAASNRLNQRIEPARVEAYRLHTALLDQETGERGYALTGDPDFLAPYTDGLQEQQLATANLRRLLSDEDDLIAGLDQIEAAAERWRRDFADPTIAAVTPGEPKRLDRAAANEAKVAFDEIRALFEVQDAELLAARTQSQSDLVDARAHRNWVLGSMILAFFAAGILMTILVLALVTRPLSRLRASSRRVAEGDFAHSITPSGPEDIRAVGRDVEQMRRRIVRDLEASREQERLLAEQAAGLDAQADELRRSNVELEQFAYVASHDLQEPLRKVASFCQLLEKRYGGQLDERGQQYIDFAVDGAKRMQVLITDLLAFSRVGRLNDISTPFDLDESLDGAVANLASAIEDSGARVERPDDLPVILGDPTLFTMVWQNLISNAIKFRSPDRPPTVTVTCQPDPNGDGEDSWLITVTDNGIGIPAEFTEKVFVIFQRLHSRDAYAGTGIGLALCRKIVEYHGGRIWIDTAHEGGTRICFTLSAAAAALRADVLAATTVPEGQPA